MEQLGIFGDILNLDEKRVVNANIPYGIPRPFFNWVGGKMKLYPQIERYIPREINTYYEPFLGGGGVFWQLVRFGRIRKAVLSDIIPDLVMAYNVVKHHHMALLDVMHRHIQYDSRGYYHLIKDAVLNDPIEIAGRFMYLVTKSYRAKMQYRDGALVPSGYMEHRAIPRQKWDGVLAMCAEALRLATIESISYCEIKPSAGDFVYFDPPYDTNDDKPTRQFYASVWARGDLVALRDFARDLSERGVLVMLSNRDTDFVRTLFNGFYIHPIVSVSNMGGAGSKAGIMPMSEILITNYPISW